MASRALSGLAEPDVRAMLASGPGPRLALQVFSWFQLCPVGGPWFSYFGLVSVASALRLLTPRPSSRPSVQSRTQLVVQPSSSPSGGFSCRLRGEGLWAKGRCCWQTCRGHFRRSGGFRLSAGQVVGFEVEGVSGRPVAASAYAALDGWLAEWTGRPDSEFPEPGAEEEGLDGRSLSDGPAAKVTALRARVAFAEGPSCHDFGLWWARLRAAWGEPRLRVSRLVQPRMLWQTRRRALASWRTT